MGAGYLGSLCAVIVCRNCTLANQSFGGIKLEVTIPGFLTGYEICSYPFTQGFAWCLPSCVARPVCSFCYGYSKVVQVPNLTYLDTYRIQDYTDVFISTSPAYYSYYPSLSFIPLVSVRKKDKKGEERKSRNPTRCFYLNISTYLR